MREPDPTRQEPRLVAAIPCRGVYHTVDGDFLTEALWGILATEYPARHGLLRLYTRWTEGAGDFALTSYIVTGEGDPLPDLSGLPQQAETVLSLAPPAGPGQPGGIATAVHEYRDLVFPAPGQYWILVSLDNTLIIQVPIWALGPTAEEGTA